MAEQISWSITYVEKGEENVQKLSGTPTDVEAAIAVIEGNHGRVVRIENSKGSVYYPIVRKEA